MFTPVVSVIMVSLGFALRESVYDDTVAPRVYLNRGYIDHSCHNEIEQTDVGEGK